MLPKQLLLLCFAVAGTTAQNRNNQDGSEITFSTTYSTLSSIPTTDFTGSDYTYVSNDQQSTVTSNNATSTTSSGSSSGTDSQSRRTSTTQQLTVIGGTTGTQTTSGTASSTSTAATPVNTIPCNGWPEFCERSYSNVTYIAAHNAAFSVPNNAASNQAYDIETQLNDGIRMIQGQTHWVNETILQCHSSCELLNVGPWQASLEVIANWIERHPYDVVTILVGNSNMVPVERYIPAIEASGIKQYLYEPAYIPQHRDQWPTLGEMILSGKRVVLFMDYMANQPKVPYILNEFTHMFETPFSPTDPEFPCTAERPPDLNETKAREQFMYMANHNLNTAIDISAITGGGGDNSLLIPNTAQINQTNGQLNEEGQLEAMRLDCESKSLFTAINTARHRANLCNRRMGPSAELYAR